MHSNSTLKGMIMNDKTTSVDFGESLSLKVGEFLLSKGFDSASKFPVAPDTPVKKARSLDILRKNPGAKPRKYLFGLITLKPRQEFIGTVWLGNKVGTNKYYWVFEVYDHKHISLAKELANEMALNFNTKIVLLHVKGQPNFETYNLIRYFGV